MKQKTKASETMTATVFGMMTATASQNSYPKQYESVTETRIGIARASQLNLRSVSENKSDSEWAILKQNRFESPRVTELDWENLIWSKIAKLSVTG